MHGSRRGRESCLITSIPRSASHRRLQRFRAADDQRPTRGPYPVRHLGLTPGAMIPGGTGSLHPTVRGLVGEQTTSRRY